MTEFAGACIFFDQLGLSCQRGLLLETEKPTPGVNKVY